MRTQDLELAAHEADVAQERERLARERAQYRVPDLDPGEHGYRWAARVVGACAAPLPPWALVVGVPVLVLGVGLVQAEGSGPLGRSRAGLLLLVAGALAVALPAAWALRRLVPLLRVGALLTDADHRLHRLIDVPPPLERDPRDGALLRPARSAAQVHRDLLALERRLRQVGVVPVLGRERLHRDWFLAYLLLLLALTVPISGMAAAAGPQGELVLLWMALFPVLVGLAVVQVVRTRRRRRLVLAREALEAEFWRARAWEAWHGG